MPTNRPFGTSAVVFDLDGTLANTGSLDIGNRIRRLPHDVLKIARTVNHSYDADELMFNDGRERIPGYLVARGYRIGIVTDSPVAYASTLIGLLRIDFERLLAGSVNRERKTKTQKLQSLIDYWKIEPEELLYVGDTEDDARAAANVGCPFMPVSQINYLRDLEEFPAIVREPASFNHASIRNDLHEIATCKQCGRRGSIDSILNDGNNLCFGCENEFSLGLNRFDLLAQIFAKLEIEPGNENRRTLQYIFFEILTKEVRDCVLDFCPEEGRFQFPPWLVTQSEISESGRLHRHFLDGLGRLFPVNGGFTEPGSAAYGYIVPYQSDHGEDLYKKLKNFQSKRDVKRPEVHHSLGWLVGAAMAANLDYLFGYVGIPYLVPIPPRGFSEEFPGEFSFRLTSRIADHLGGYYNDLFHPFLVRDGSNIAIEYDLFQAFLYTSNENGWVDVDILLIDDQHTMGNSMRKAKTAITEALPPGAKVSISSFTWSKSMVQDQIKSTGCLTEEHSHLYSRKCLCKSPNLRQSKMKASVDLLFGYVEDDDESVEPF